MSDAGIQTNHESFQPRKYKPVSKNIHELHIIRSPSCEEIHAICKITLRSYCLPTVNGHGARSKNSRHELRLSGRAFYRCIHCLLSSRMRTTIRLSFMKT